jgi:hypothetical protein
MRKRIIFVFVSISLLMLVALNPYEPSPRLPTPQVYSLSVADQWTHGFRIQFLYSKFTDGPTLLLSVTRIEQTGQHTPIHIDGEWMARFRQSLSEWEWEHYVFDPWKSRARDARRIA